MFGVIRFQVLIPSLPLWFQPPSLLLRFQPPFHLWKYRRNKQIHVYIAVCTYIHALMAKYFQQKPFTWCIRAQLRVLRGSSVSSAVKASWVYVNRLSTSGEERFSAYVASREVAGVFRYSMLLCIEPQLDFGVPWLFLFMCLLMKMFWVGLFHSF